MKNINNFNESELEYKGTKVWAFKLSSSNQDKRCDSYINNPKYNIKILNARGNDGYTYNVHQRYNIILNNF